MAGPLFPRWGQPAEGWTCLACGFRWGVAEKPKERGACPKCGCKHASRVQRYVRWGQTTERRWCRFCGSSYLVPVGDSDIREETPPVFYRPVPCPVCGSANTRVVFTRRPERQHVCEDCGQPFKSIERPAP